MAIVGTGPIGLAAALTAQLLTPSRIIAIDLADSRLNRPGGRVASTGLHGHPATPRPHAVRDPYFALDDTMAAYDTFADAATTDALKVVLSGSEVPAASTPREAALAAL